MKECNSCGKCCIKYSDGRLYASPDEIEYWQVFRPNIAKYTHNGNIWTHPSTEPNAGAAITRCPWLQKSDDGSKYLCSIYYDRPDDCKHYPSNIAEMINDECEMIELVDLQDKETAQRTLDTLMADSR
jgi:uncharacterized protein